MKDKKWVSTFDFSYFLWKGIHAHRSQASLSFFEHRLEFLCGKNTSRACWLMTPKSSKTREICLWSRGLHQYLRLKYSTDFLKKSWEDFNRIKVTSFAGVELNALRLRYACLGLLGGLAEHFLVNLIKPEEAQASLRAQGVGTSSSEAGFAFGLSSPPAPPSYYGVSVILQRAQHRGFSSKTALAGFALQGFKDQERAKLACWSLRWTKPGALGPWLWIEEMTPKSP